MRKLLVVLVGLLLVSGGGVSCAVLCRRRQAGKPPRRRRPRLAPGKKVIATGTIEPEEVVNVWRTSGWPDREPRRGPSFSGQVDRLEFTGGSGHRLGADRQPALCGPCRTAAGRLRLRRSRVGTGRRSIWKSPRPNGNSPRSSRRPRPYRTPISTPAKFNYEAAKPAVTVAEAALAAEQGRTKRSGNSSWATPWSSRRSRASSSTAASTWDKWSLPANATSSLFLVAKLDKLKVWASVNEADIAQVHQQQPVRFTVDACPGKVFEGKVEQIRLNATMAQNVVTYTVVIAISGPPKELLPYMTANVTFE